MKEKTLYIGRWSSSCGACGKPANLSEKGHFTLLGYGEDNGKPGCGTIWEYVTPTYVGPKVESTIKSMKPNLKYKENWVGER